MITPASNPSDRFGVPISAPFGRAGNSFEQTLARSSANREALEGAATEFVSSAFIMPVFAAMQQSTLRPTSGPFAVGDAEKRFSPLLHQHLADRLTKASKLSLVDAIVDRFASRPDKEILNVRV